MINEVPMTTDLSSNISIIITIYVVMNGDGEIIVILSTSKITSGNEEFNRKCIFFSQFRFKNAYGS